MMIPQVSGYPDYDVFMTEQVPGPRRSKIAGRHMWTVPKIWEKLFCWESLRVFSRETNFLWLKVE